MKCTCFRLILKSPDTRQTKIMSASLRGFQRATSLIPPAVHLATTTSPKSAFSESIISRATPVIISSSTLTTNNKNHIQNSSKANLKHLPFYIHLVIDCSQQPKTVSRTDRAEKKKFHRKQCSSSLMKSTQKITSLNALKKILSDPHFIFKRRMIVPSSL